jgi:hypothetical protein
LESQGGYFGSVLRLVQHLEAMPDAERLRWLELLSYIMALV